MTNCRRFDCSFQMLRYPTLPVDQLPVDIAAIDSDDVDSTKKEHLSEEVLSGLPEEERNRLKYVQKRRSAWQTVIDLFSLMFSVMRWILVLPSYCIKVFVMTLKSVNSSCT